MGVVQLPQRHHVVVVVALAVVAGVSCFVFSLRDSYLFHIYNSLLLVFCVWRFLALALENVNENLGGLFSGVSGGGSGVGEDKRKLSMVAAKAIGNWRIA